MLSQRPILALLILIATIIVFRLALAQSAVYKCTDEDGATTFSDTPCAEESEIHQIEETYSPDPNNRVIYRQFRHASEGGGPQEEGDADEMSPTSPESKDSSREARRERPEYGNRTGGCASEQGMCISRCQGDAQCIATCNASYGRCVGQQPRSFGQCAGACASEQGICIANCKGDIQCIPQCNASHGRCMARCNR